MWRSRMGGHHGVLAPSMDLRSRTSQDRGWRTCWRRLPIGARQDHDQDRLVRVPREEQSPHPVPVHRSRFYICRARWLPQESHGSRRRHSRSHRATWWSLPCTHCRALTWRIFSPWIRLPPWLQQDLSPDHNEDCRRCMVLLSCYRVQECDRHHQRRSATWRTPRRANTSVSQPFCALGQAIQGDPRMTIDTPRTNSHGPCIQRSSTHESWSHDQRIWPNGGERKHSLLWGDRSMVPEQQLWLGTTSSWFWKVPIGEIMSRTKGDCNGEHGASCLQGLAGRHWQRGQHPVLWQIRRGCCKAWITQWSP